MNISNVGTPASSALSTYYSGAYSQRLLQLRQQQGGHDGLPAAPLGVADKKRLIPSRRREERMALQNIQYRLELSKMLHSSSNDEFMRTVFGKKAFLRKAAFNRQSTYVHDEDCQEDIYDNEFIQEALLWHNIYRQRHDSLPLKLSSQLCGKAQSWANHLAHTNTFLYDIDKSVGQNIFCQLYADAETDISAQNVVSFWYSCYKNYTFNKDPETLHVSINAGSFTQLVWKSTTLFGIGRARSRAGKVLVVANYQPVGNICALFKENVLPASSHKK